MAGARHLAVARVKFLQHGYLLNAPASAPCAGEPTLATLAYQGLAEHTHFVTLGQCVKKVRLMWRYNVESQSDLQKKLRWLLLSGLSLYEYIKTFHSTYYST